MYAYRQTFWGILAFLYIMSALAVVGVAHGADMGMGFVNIPAIMEKAPQASAARERLQLEFSARRKAIESCSRDIEDIDKTLRSEGRDMAKSRRDRMIEEIRSIRRECDRRKEDFDADFNLRRKEEVLELEQLITRIISKIAEKRNLQLIVGPPIVYVDEQANLTEEVLDALSRDKR